MPFRIDARGSVRNVTETPQGGLRIEAAVRRTGILEYPQAGGGVRRELVTSAELSRADSLATLRNAPVTNRHPPGAVTRKNFRQYAVGHVDGDGALDGDHLLSALVVQADDALADVETAQAREVSAGYTCDLDETPGTYEGQPYDAVQTNVRYNHVALVPKGRAGSSVCLRLDSAGDTVVGVEPDTTPTDTQETQSMTPAEIAKLQADLAAATLRADTAEGQNKVNAARADKAEADLKARTDAEELAAVVAVASKLVKDFKADGKTAAQIKAEVVASKFPALKLDAAHLDGAYLAASAMRADNVQELRASARPVVETETRTDAAPLTSEQKRAKMIADGDARYRVAKEAAAKGAK